MIENNSTFKPAYEADSIVVPSSRSCEKTYYQKEFSPSRYFFILNLLEGHNKIEKDHSFPKVNPTEEHYSKLVILLNKSGLSLN
jgi:hypothetical protein